MVSALSVLSLVIDGGTGHLNSADVIVIFSSHAVISLYKTVTLNAIMNRVGTGKRAGIVQAVAPGA